MRIVARPAELSDTEAIAGLYEKLEEEMIALHGMWPLADGLPDPITESISDAITDPESLVVIGTIDDYPFGFLIGRVEPLLARAGGEQVGVIRQIFVDHDAREVAVGEAMRDAAMEWFRQRGISKFDAHVLPGHRLAKNFFEAGGFSARSIVMHHDDDRE